MLLSARLIVPNESDKGNKAAAFLEVSACVCGDFLNDLGKGTLALPKKLHFDDHAQRGDGKISTRMMLTKRLEPFLVVEIGKDWGKDDLQYVLHMVLVLNIPLCSSRPRRTGSIIPRPAAQRVADAGQQARYVCRCRRTGSQRRCVVQKPVKRGKLRCRPRHTIVFIRQRGDERPRVGPRRLCDGSAPPCGKRNGQIVRDALLLSDILRRRNTGACRMNKRLVPVGRTRPSEGLRQQYPQPLQRLICLDLVKLENADRNAQERKAVDLEGKGSALNEVLSRPKPRKCFDKLVG